MASGADVRVERALSLLRERRGRVTKARRAVLSALVGRDDHATADELADAVRARHPEVHLSTVYRSLDAFERLGVVTHVHLGHGRATYHLAEELHHHAVCEGCGAVVELPDDLLGAVVHRVRGEFGFEVDAHHFALSGRCAACATSN